MNIKFTVCGDDLFSANRINSNIAVSRFPL